MKTIRNSLIIALVLGLSTTICVQVFGLGPVGIQGKVVDPKSGLASSVWVILKDKDGNLVYSLTGDDGQYNIDAGTTGDYDLFVTKQKALIKPLYQAKVTIDAKVPFDITLP